MSEPAADRVLIVGGGAFGLTAALELRRRGHGVELLDAGSLPHPDASSTDVSKAVRMDYGDDRFYADLARVALERWRGWNESWGEQVYHQTGILLLSGGSLDGAGFEADSFRLVRACGVPAERLAAAAIGARFPQWSQHDFVDGYFNPEAGYVESDRAMAHIKRAAVVAGVRLREAARCARLHEDGSRVAGVVLDDGGIVRADTVVVAAGAWTPFLLPQLQGLMWATGQPVVLFRPRDPSAFAPQEFPVWCADITRTGRYGFPLNRDGLVKLGHHGDGSRYVPGEPLIVSERQRDAAVEFARQTFPGLRDAEPAQTRLCLYCDTWDGDFLIDHDPDRPGLVVAAGGSGHGFKFAPVLGEIVADVVERKPNAAATRFAWREPGARRTEQTRQKTVD